MYLVAVGALFGLAVLVFLVIRVINAKGVPKGKAIADNFKVLFMTKV